MNSEIVNVIVVDDNEDAADMLSEVLSLDGYSVRTARNAAEALLRISAHRGRHFRLIVDGISA